MVLKRISIVIAAILITLGIYYREQIPTTRTDFENLYYYLKASLASTKTEQADEFSSEENLNQNEPPIQTYPNEDQMAQEVNTESQDGNLNTDTGTPTQNKKTTILPDSINNYTPFTPQAPLGEWDKFHDAACEEASLVMAHYYLEKRDVVFSKEAEKDIQFVGSKMKGGGIEDLTVAELKTVAKEIYGYKNWRIVDKPEIQDIKVELAQGNIIIIPLAGREIGNPYYKNPGPLYHMLIISGYDDKKSVFITQDPGTKRGKDFEYKYSVLMKAIHDFPGNADKIDQGTVKILVIAK